MEGGMTGTGLEGTAPSPEKGIRQQKQKGLSVMGRGLHRSVGRGTDCEKWGGGKYSQPVTCATKGLRVMGFLFFGLHIQAS
jgi:hypothetical protein